MVPIVGSFAQKGCIDQSLAWYQAQLWPHGPQQLSQTSNLQFVSCLWLNLRAGDGTSLRKDLKSDCSGTPDSMGSLTSNVRMHWAPLGLPWEEPPHSRCCDPLRGSGGTNSPGPRAPWFCLHKYSSFLVEPLSYSPLFLRTGTGKL